MELLAHTDEVTGFCRQARAEGLVGLDMEFERERTYRPVLQLVQAATRERAVLIDPLAIDDLSPLWELIADPAVELIVHAGMQDMEIAFAESGGLVPANVFDTQIAAALLGMGEQPGYADVVRRITGVHLKKGERTTDWSRRPLSKAQAQYALDDVLYLHQLYDEIDSELENRGRRPWLDEELGFYEQRENYERDPGQLWLRVSRHRSLKGKQLAVLRELAIWREEAAAARNVPRMRVVADDVLVDLARRNPQTVEDLQQLRRLHHREIERGADEILAAVARGLACPPDEHPKLPKVHDDDPELNVTVDLLATFVKYRAREKSIAPSYLGNKKQIAAFALAHRQKRSRDGHPLGSGWRYEMVGRDLEQFLDGRLALSVEEGRGRLRLIPVGKP
ncbi:MAG TPA: ribonuclease D [Candidatus Krumholzibacteria bacterium]|nr:ribonuclease D [Candidatus Krumholzibacteria bacterium]